MSIMEMRGLNEQELPADVESEAANENRAHVKPSDLTSVALSTANGDQMLVSFCPVEESDSPFSKFVAYNRTQRVGIAFDTNRNQWFLQWHSGNLAFNQALIEHLNQTKVEHLVFETSTGIKTATKKVA